MGGFVMPRYLAAALAGESDPHKHAWAEGLPDTVARATARWSLELGAPFEPGGQCSWVAPAGDDLVLKVTWSHAESRHEAEGLVLWAGDGAVRVHDTAVDGASTLLLLERCRPGHVLKTIAEPEQDVVIARLLHQLWITPPDGHPFRPLVEMCDLWASACEAAPQRLDAAMVRDGLALFRSLPRTATTSVLLCTDLHGDNVLAAGRAPWLVIDPKPYVGDPHYDVLQHILNCEDRLHEDPVRLAHRMADLAGLDRTRVVQWLFARCVQESPTWPNVHEVARRLATMI